MKSTNVRLVSLYPETLKRKSEPSLSTRTYNTLLHCYFETDLGITRRSMQEATLKDFLENVSPEQYLHTYGVGNTIYQELMEYLRDNFGVVWPPLEQLQEQEKEHQKKAHTEH